MWWGSRPDDTNSVPPGTRPNGADPHRRTRCPFQLLGAGVGCVRGLCVVCPDHTRRTTTPQWWHSDRRAFATQQTNAPYLSVLVFLCIRHLLLGPDLPEPGNIGSRGNGGDSKMVETAAMETVANGGTSGDSWKTHVRWGLGVFESFRVVRGKWLGVAWGAFLGCCGLGNTEATAMCLAGVIRNKQHACNLV